VPVSYLSIGANINDRLKNIISAIKMIGNIQKTRVDKISSFYRTEGVDSGCDMPEFINCMVEIKTFLTPQKLLKEINDIEYKMGRRRGDGKKPRIIDIDIVLYNDLVVNTDKLTIPHPRAKERRFVLLPLSEIAPDIRFPDTGETVVETLKELSENPYVQKL
jgi:2-amino-4-hydroxy-6-hydroxymethyldihydropteridine diphosphokinase